MRILHDRRFRAPLETLAPQDLLQIESEDRVRFKFTKCSHGKKNSANSNWKQSQWSG